MGVLPIKTYLPRVLQKFLQCLIAVLVSNPNNSSDLKSGTVITKTYILHFIEH